MKQQRLSKWKDRKFVSVLRHCRWKMGIIGNASWRHCPANPVYSAVL